MQMICTHCGEDMLPLFGTKMYCPKDCDKLEQSKVIWAIPPEVAANLPAVPLEVAVKLPKGPHSVHWTAINSPMGHDTKQATALVKWMSTNGPTSKMKEEVIKLVPSIAYIHYTIDPIRLKVVLKPGHSKEDLPAGIRYHAYQISVIEIAPDNFSYHEVSLKDKGGALH